MWKIIKTLVLWNILMIVLSFSFWACHNPCEELARLCEKCPSGVNKEQCKAVTRIADSDACVTGLATWQSVCRSG